MIIPWTSLSEDALRGVIEEFITREGTDYGDRVISLDDKVEQVRGQLDRGDVFLSFDPLSQSCQLFPREFRAALQSLDEEES